MTASLLYKLTGRFETLKSHDGNVAVIGQRDYQYHNIGQTEISSVLLKQEQMVDCSVGNLEFATSRPSPNKQLRD